MLKDKSVLAQMVGFLITSSSFTSSKSMMATRMWSTSPVGTYFYFDVLPTLQSSKSSWLDYCIASLSGEMLPSWMVGKDGTRSNLAKANENRDYRIFEDFAFYIIDETRKCNATEIFKLYGNAYAFDSTTIDLCLELFPWTKFRNKEFISHLLVP